MADISDLYEECLACKSPQFYLNEQHEYWYCRNCGYRVSHIPFIDAPEE